MLVCITVEAGYEGHILQAQFSYKQNFALHWLGEVKDNYWYKHSTPDISTCAGSQGGCAYIQLLLDVISVLF